MSETLHQRHPCGLAINHWGALEVNYPPIPQAKGGMFQSRYGYEVPVCIDGWQWSGQYGRWSALVRFRDGSKRFTYPKL
jgi:hypothetical protein